MWPHSDSDVDEPGALGAPDALTLGRRLRHLRKARGLTLDDLGRQVGVTPSLLSLFENGRREPRLALLRSLAGALDVTVADLLDAEPPSRRAALEIALDRAQRSAGFERLSLPSLRPGRSLPLPVLEHLVGLHAELARRDLESVATPEEARRANTQIRLERQARDNYLPDIERLAESMARKAGYLSGALTHRAVSRMAEQLGLAIIHVDDLPASTRTVTDLEHGRVYLPPASTPGGHGLRSLALQAIAHRVLGHERPASYDEFLRQRMETTYFASCCLMPETAAVEHLRQHKKEKDLAIEDLRDAFGVTHEAAAQRFTSLATHHLGIPVHFVRIGGDGAIYRAYANDGLPLPTDVTGAIEGQLVCRSWGVRRALTRRDRTSESYQYTDTPAGTFWCSTQTGLRHHGAARPHGRCAVRVRDVVPRPGHQGPAPVDVSRRGVLPTPAGRRLRPLAGRLVAQRPDPPAGVHGAAHGCLPRGRRPRGVRVPRSARASGPRLSRGRVGR